MSDSRPILKALRSVGPLGAVTATALLGAGLLGAANLARDDDPPPPASSTAPAPAASAAAPPASSAPPAAPPTSAAAPDMPGTGAGGPVAVAAAPVSLRYTFDGGPNQPVVDATGRFPMHPLTEAGGGLTFAPVPGTAPAAARTPAGGFALQFPPRCHQDPTTCPRAILEGIRDDALNPGTRPMRFGASVLIGPADTGDGANVVQKGYSVGGETQFKLQVDHETAYPSCVLAGARIYRVESRTSLADNAWHTVVCLRRGSRLGITVDGVPRGFVTVPAGLSIANAEPLRIGGKGTAPGNDQFSGQVDNVFLDIV